MLFYSLVMINTVKETRFLMSFLMQKEILHQSNDFINEIKKLLKFNQIKAVLTSGGQKNAVDGQENIKKLFERFKDEIDIIAAGSITNKNIKKIHKTLGLKIYHGKKIVDS